MSSSIPNNYIIIFDTNILYNKSQNKCNFCEFKFNRLFQNIVHEIEERDLIEYFTIAIPDVTWSELYQQRMQAYNSKNKELEKLLEDFKFPHIQYEFSELNYEIYLKEQIKLFKEKLNNYLTKVISIDLPSETRFNSIVSRALTKKPPFEGIDKKSDKGFKDALIWESILEYKAKNVDCKLILYSRDGLFNEVLAEEYYNLFTDNILLLDKEGDVIKQIAEVQKNVNQLGKLVIDEIKYYDELKRLLDLNFIKKVIFEIELSKRIGSNIYDVSDVREVQINNMNETTEDDTSGLLKFEISVKVNVTISSFEKEDDIDIEDEEIILYVEYRFLEKSFYLTKILVLEDIYKLDDIQIGDGKYV